MLNIVICVGSSCHVKGAPIIVETFQKKIKEYSLEKKIDLSGSFCMQTCSGEKKDLVSITIDGEKHFISPDLAEEFFTNTILPRVD
ncbi:MAG: (2Fe-2S) ferredoxin domain-containing protein [Synergistaceae bacterium]